MDPLRILVIDEHAAMALPVIDALSQRGHRCELQPTATQALELITTRRDTGRPFHAVVANAALPDLDPVAFLRVLRDQRERLPVVLYAVMAQLERSVFEGAAALDARFLDLPIDRARLVLLVESLRSDREGSGPRAATADQPFFGTGRITRATPTSGRYQQPSGSEAAPRPPTPPPQPTVPPIAPVASPRTNRTPLPHSGNAVRQGTDTFANAAPVPTTSRIRRDITGRIQRPPAVVPPPAEGWRVACAKCRGEFLVEPRPQAYNIVCVHCGQLNRIEPRPA